MIKTIRELEQEIGAAHTRATEDDARQRAAEVNRTERRKRAYNAARKQAIDYAAYAQHNPLNAQWLGENLKIPIEADVQLVDGGAFVGCTVFIPAGGFDEETTGRRARRPDGHEETPTS